MHIRVFQGKRRSGGLCEAKGIMFTNSNNLYIEIELGRILSVSGQYAIQAREKQVWSIQGCPNGISQNYIACQEINLGRSLANEP